MQFWAFFGMVWVCFLRFSVPQDEFIFPSDDDSNNDAVFPTVDGIPESLLLRMKDVGNASDFLRKFVVQPDLDYSTEGEQQISFVNARRAFSPGRRGPEIAQYASCVPELQVVKLEQTSPASGVMLWPPCVRVKRCGGCCTSKLLKCQPSAVSTINVTVLQVHISPQRLDAFESDGERILSLEQHDRCACSCRQTSDECVPTIQEYRQSECRCVCVNLDQALRCTGPDRLWDSGECLCKCRRPTDCSTGFYYSFITCRCEVFRDTLLAAFPSLITRFQNLTENDTISEHRSKKDVVPIEAPKQQP